MRVLAIVRLLARRGPPHLAGTIFLVEAIDPVKAAVHLRNRSIVGEEVRKAFVAASASSLSMQHVAEKRFTFAQ